MNQKPLARLLAVLILAGLLPQVSAWAHRLDAEYEQADHGYRIEFFLGDGSPANDLSVTAQLAGGEPIQIGTTNAEGIVWFVPPSPGEWKIVGTGMGHSTSRNPLVIQVGPGDASGPVSGQVSGPAIGAVESGKGKTMEVAKPQAATWDAARPARRGQFPWLEIGGSLGFTALLTLITLAMMRRSARGMGRPTELDQLSHEVDHLRATITQLREEIAELKEHDEPRAR